MCVCAYVLTVSPRQQCKRWRAVTAAVAAGARAARARRGCRETRRPLRARAGRRGRAACGERPERRAAQGRVVRLAARGPQGGARPPPQPASRAAHSSTARDAGALFGVTQCKFIDMTLNIFGLLFVCYWVVISNSSDAHHSHPWFCKQVVISATIDIIENNCNHQNK